MAGTDGESLPFVIRDMTAEGLAVILLGDTLEEVIGLSSRILVMRDGAITARLEQKVAE